MSARPHALWSRCEACLLRTRRAPGALRRSVHYRTAVVSRDSLPAPFSPKRSYATAAPGAHFHYQIPDCGLVRLADRRLLSLSGPDAQRFLQGLITADVSSPRDSPFYCAFLDARGRVLWDVFIYPFRRGEEWGCYIDVDTEEIGNLYKHLRRHKLRSKVTLEVLPEAVRDGAGNLDGLSVHAAWRLPQEEHGEELAARSGGAFLQDPRFPALTRFVLPASTSPSDHLSAASPALEPRSDWEYRALRYVHGVPEGPTEISRENALPMEYNIDLADGIDFRKGCYVGQELTIRTKHTGVVRKRVLPVRLYQAADRGSVPSSFTEHVKAGVDLGFGASLPGVWKATSDEELGEQTALALDIKKADTAPGPDGQAPAARKSRPVGKLIARVGDVGLALCRLDVMVPWQFSGDGAVQSAFVEGTEFEVANEGGLLGGVRVRAYLPASLVTREREIWSKKGNGRKRVMEGEDVD